MRSNNSSAGLIDTLVHGSEIAAVLLLANFGAELTGYRSDNTNVMPDAEVAAVANYTPHQSTPNLFSTSVWESMTLEQKLDNLDRRPTRTR